MFQTYLLQPFGVDFFCLGKKFLVFNLVSRNLKVKYRRSFFGFLWTILSPMAMAVVYYFVFKVVLKIQIPRYLVFILSGILPWTFFAQTLAEGMESIVGNLGLISKISVQAQVFPFVGSLTNLVTLTLTIPILICASMISGVSAAPSLVMLLYYFGTLFLIAYSISSILAIAFVFFRDLRHILGIVLQIWMYGTPVIYDEVMIPEKYKWILYANPVGMVFKGIHCVLVQGAWPSGLDISIPALWMFGLFLVSAWLQKVTANGLVESI